jgi:hypothetical protein
VRRDGLPTRRPTTRLAAPTLVEQILELRPAQWLRFTSENVAPNTPGAELAAVTDLTPNARNASQGTSTQQPIFANPGANFDGTDDVLTSSGGAFLNGIASASIFIVADLAGEALTDATQMYGVDSQAFYFSFGGTSGAPRMVINPGGLILPAGPTGRSGATGKFLFDTRLVNGASRTWDNGSPGTNITTAWGAGTIPCNATPNVGAGTVLGARPFPGTIQDVIVFTPALSLAAQAKVRTLLAQLDGVTL